MSSAKKRQILFLQALAVLIITAVSCNSKATEDETEIAVTPAMVAVKNFYLQSNDSVMKNLDSVFFSIDLNTGVIFNADSLPKGTNVSKLLPSITFANAMTKAELIFFKGDETEQTTVDYLTNPGDTIDFSQPVLLEVTAQDGLNTFTYTIKVNVHEQVPDTIIWNHVATSSLPSRFPSPVAQKTIKKGDMIYCLVEEYNGEYTLSTTDDLFEGNWQSSEFNPGFYPDTETFTATSDAFYLTNVYGELYYSADLTEWTDTELDWTTVIGAYGDILLGIRREGAEFLHTQYPRGEEYEEIPLEEGFPIFHSTSLGIVETKWADRPTAILAGGMTADGNLSSNVWAFDGTTWAVINSTDLPALEMPMMTRYVVYRDTPAAFLKREFDVWLLFGGIDFDNVMNREVFMSYDNGVHWSPAPSGMQLPDSFPDLGGSDIIVDGYSMSANLSDAWTLQSETKTRASYTIEGYDITWICPYLYVFGGYKPYPDNSLSTYIFRGALERLKFTPQI